MTCGMGNREDVVRRRGEKEEEFEESLGKGGPDPGIFQEGS